MQAGLMIAEGEENPEDETLMLLHTPSAELGSSAPDFALPDLDGNVVTRTTAMGDSGLLIAFICNHCPYVKAIVERLAEDLAALRREGVGVVAIMSNDYRDYPSDSPANMRRFSAKHGFSFPYLLDEDQSVAKAYGAICTPDFFGYDAVAKLRYRGRLDDAKMGDPQGRTPELLDAMKLVIETGVGPKEQHASIGCSIKWS